MIKDLRKNSPFVLGQVVDLREYCKLMKQEPGTEVAAHKPNSISPLKVKDLFKPQTDPKKGYAVTIPMIFKDAVVTLHKQPHENVLHVISVVKKQP